MTSFNKENQEKTRSKLSGHEKGAKILQHNTIVAVWIVYNRRNTRYFINKEQTFPLG